MNFYTNNEQFEARSKKKYDLSLKSIKKVTLKNRGSTDCPTENDASFRTLETCGESSIFTDSQKIELRVSDSFLVQDTQENNERSNAEGKNFASEEVILISDSSEAETSLNHHWAQLETSKFESGAEHRSPLGKIYTIQLSESDEDGKIQDSLGQELNHVFRRKPTRRRSSMYTSDETVSDTELRKLHNKENLFKSRLNPAADENVIPDSDESIFSFDRRGILTDNRRNIVSPKSPRSLKKTNDGTEDIRNIRSTDKTQRDKMNNAESLREINSRIEAWRRTPECLKVSNNKTGSLNNLIEIQRKIEESRKTPDSSMNKATGLSKSKERNRRFEMPEKTSEPSRASKNEIGRLQALGDTYGRFGDSRKTPEFPKITKDQTACLDNLKETTKNVEKSEETRECPKTVTKETVNMRIWQKYGEREEEAERTPVSANKISTRTVLSKKDVRKILRVVESKRAVYQTPEKSKEPSISSENDDSENENNDAPSPESESSPKNVRETEDAIVIAETDSDSEDKIIRGSKVNLSKPYKTHVTRFLDPDGYHDSPDGMSERKKLEIAHWLMTNSATAASESSVSNISASNKYSLSSGDSSLERLEMNYETPNNRDKMRKLHTDERRRNDRVDSTKSTKPRQTTIDNFVKISDDGTKKILTPLPILTRRKITPEKDKLTENLEIEDCADILDNLYGNTWRSKANELLPMSEPRKKNTLLRDKGVQTERKANPRSKRVTKSSDSSMQEDGFDTFVKNIKPNLNSTKKVVKRTDRYRFITGSSSSSESGGETTYLTALTNPRISNDRKTNSRKTPLSLHVQRAIAICDSDFEDEDGKAVDNRKVLSFSDDENDSSTSEYDPNYSISEKIKTKKNGVTVSTKNVTRNTKIPVPVKNSGNPKQKCNFLASLSATVPLNESHPDAKKYRMDYKNTKEELCKYLYKLYNDNIFDNKLPSDMSIEWNVRMRGTAGFCYNKRSVKALGGVTRSSRIVLATKILDTPDRLRDTLVHEMCHAAAWLINDVSDGHGPFWKAWAAKAMKAFPDLPPIKRCHDYKITTKFTYRCTSCGYSIGRHSKSLDVERKRCGHCYGKFELLINKVTKSGEVESKTPVSKKPSAFALFVKENYSTVKKERKGVPHKEVMQILGQQFSAIKITRKHNNSDENNSLSGD